MENKVMNMQLKRKRTRFSKVLGGTIILMLSLMANPLFAAVTLEMLAEKMAQLEVENLELRKILSKLQAGQVNAEKERVSYQQATASSINKADLVGINSKYSFDMLDPTTRINRKQLYILEQKQNGKLKDNTVTLGGAVTAIVDAQHSNTDSKFGYLMRHPTSNNQIGHDVSEAVLHSVQIELTASLGSWVTAYSEILYDPQQSFARGTVTALDRNQLQLRRGYVLLGNLDKSPFYLSVGKMATPFGLTDTVNPFTASTVWHAFGGLAYGIQGGYSKDGLNVRVMGVQGGSQFRGANTSVRGTNVPSKLNNYVIDSNYTYDLGKGNTLMAGVSYERGSAYCHDFPVVHFNPCADENPAYSLYSELNWGNFKFLAEFAKTVDKWPGTFNPAIPEFSAEKVTSWGLGGRYRTALMGQEVDLSVEFSRYVAGPDGAPWERQDQTVFGLSSYLTPSVKLFGEYIHTAGYVPLNFISGGNLTDPAETHSVRGAESDILLIGINAAF